MDKSEDNVFVCTLVLETFGIGKDKAFASWVNDKFPIPSLFRYKLSTPISHTSCDPEERKPLIQCMVDEDVLTVVQSGIFQGEVRWKRRMK